MNCQQPILKTMRVGTSTQLQRHVIKITAGEWDQRKWNRRWMQGPLCYASTELQYFGRAWHGWWWMKAKWNESEWIWKRQCKQQAQTTIHKYRDPSRLCHLAHLAGGQYECGSPVWLSLFFIRKALVKFMYRTIRCIKMRTIVKVIYSIWFIKLWRANIVPCRAIACRSVRGAINASIEWMRAWYDMSCKNQCAGCLLWKNVVHQFSMSFSLRIPPQRDKALAWWSKSFL